MTFEEWLVVGSVFVPVVSLATLWIVVRVASSAWYHGQRASAHAARGYYRGE